MSTKIKIIQILNHLFKHGRIGIENFSRYCPFNTKFLFKRRCFLGYVLVSVLFLEVGCRLCFLAAVQPSSLSAAPPPAASRAVPAVRVQVRILGHLAGSLSGCNRGSSEHFSLTNFSQKTTVYEWDLSVSWCGWWWEWLCWVSVTLRWMTVYWLIPFPSLSLLLGPDKTLRSFHNNISSDGEN